MNCFNREEIKNKCHGCWIGKNIGGTIGTPYEGKQEMNHAEGFSSQPGEPLANDDLDLQLVWLLAMEKSGPWFLDEQKLGDYWLAMISPHWNEYGLCKGNMLAGYLPPLSGELKNPIWKDANGAWMRSEIWASLAPGHPGIARRYAFADACVDHGFGEGTYAALFTATLESEAYLYSSKEDIRLILEKALAAIPRDCRVAKAVSLAIEEYDKHTPYEVTREKLAEQSRDIGVFEAPANLGYVTIGLLYGEG
ncbi:MAG: ADP-ribosylglycohydrolase family protein, partial [Clostridia bacterium]|nr:ADP-ribosylglycohydrolase family protein [Clostridia bacterium]